MVLPCGDFRGKAKRLCPWAQSMRGLSGIVQLPSTWGNSVRVGSDSNMTVGRLGVSF